ncbi:MAG: alkaline phosphatase D family protein [Vicinamibacterales bacterium]
MRRISRRSFLATGSAALGTLPLLRCGPGTPPPSDPAFFHGVASGDPLSDRVMLWTRVSPKVLSGSVSVSWSLAKDPKLAQVVARGQTETGASRDFTVKIDAPGLEPATTYYYRFEALGSPSPIGRTRTLPMTGVDRVRLGIASCANLPFGYFNAYASLAQRHDLDAVLHLGDYFYEYENGKYGDGTKLNRVPSPNKEILALADYRERYAQYRSDPDLQAVHRQHPFIVVWDDHEIANDTWMGGAENHASDEGAWMARRAAAVRAFFEWMPVREDDQTRLPRIYRTFSFGDLADLIMLDTRLVGRDMQVEREDVKGLELPSRTILGPAQEAWLAAELAESTRVGTLWQALGQQVMFAAQRPVGEPGRNADSWDGYRACRDRVFDAVEQARVKNLAVLTGDVHSSWAYDLPRRPFDAYDPSTGKGSVGVEIVGTSVTSPSSIGAGPEGEKQIADLRAARPHLHYVDGRYRGYVIMDVNRERLQADYFAVKPVEDRSSDASFVKGFVTETNRNHFVETTIQATGSPAVEPAP